MLLGSVESKPYRPLSKYPHLLRANVAVWDAWLRLMPNAFKHVWYDVHVGTAVPTPGGPNSMLSRISRGITRKRIDVVAWDGLLFHVIELKPWANAEALGQCLIYYRLFQQEYRPIKTAKAVVICWRPEADVVYDYDRQGVEIWSIEDIAGPLRT